MIRRGGIYQGAVKGAGRTWMVLSNDDANSVFDHVVVVWVFTDSNQTTLVELGQAVGLEEDAPLAGAVCPHFVQTVPASVLTEMRYLGHASSQTMASVDALLSEVLDLI